MYLHTVDGLRLRRATRSIIWRRLLLASLFASLTLTVYYWSQLLQSRSTVPGFVESQPAPVDDNPPPQPDSTESVPTANAVEPFDDATPTIPQALIDAAAALSTLVPQEYAQIISQSDADISTTAHREPDVQDPPEMWDALTVTVQAKQKVASEFLAGNRLVFGIPTVYRSRNYLQNTIAGLLSGLAEGQAKSVTIYVLNGQVPASDHLLIPQLREKYRDQVERGELVFDQIPARHRQMRQPLKQTFDDPLDRVYWRSKQVLDFAYLMEGASKLGDYYIQLEDDLEVGDNYVTEIAWWLATYYANKVDWFMLSFYAAGRYDDHQSYAPTSFYGFIGQLYNSIDIPLLVAYFRQRFDEKPVDWLMIDYLQDRVPEERRKIVAHAPSLFNHIGVTSSLPGKVQPLAAHAFYQLQDLLDRPPPLNWPDEHQQGQLARQFWEAGGMGVLILVKDHDELAPLLAETIAQIYSRSCTATDHNCWNGFGVHVVNRDPAVASNWTTTLQLIRARLLALFPSISAQHPTTVHLINGTVDWSVEDSNNQYTMILEYPSMVRRGYLSIAAVWLQRYFTARSDWDVIYAGQFNPGTDRHLIPASSLTSISGCIVRTKMLKNIPAADGSLLSALDRSPTARIFKHSPPLVQSKTNAK